MPDVVVLLIVILIVLSLMFGGFQKGTKSSGLGPLPCVHLGCTSAKRNYRLTRGGCRFRAVRLSEEMRVTGG